MIDITDEMIKECLEPTYTNISEIDVFNLIGNAVEEKGYVAIYWKWKRPSMLGSYNDIQEWKWVHYIHILKDEDLRLSIYYDEHDAMALMGIPYYELYYGGDIERFPVSDEAEMELFDRVKSYLIG